MELYNKRLIASDKTQTMSPFEFPLGIAQTPYFCNRVTETETLLNNIHSHTHTILISPRRYGKTSLAYHAMKKSGLAFTKIDLYMTTDAQAVETVILQGINTLIAQVSGVTDKILSTLKRYLHSLKPTLKAGSAGFTLELESTGAPATETIAEALSILEQILKSKKQHAVLLLDEFQELECIAKNQGIEGAIRHVAQEAQHFSLIFSGSQRHLLKSMFNDRNKPLYRLCDEILLERIAEQDYVAFINRFAKKKWQQPMPTECITTLLTKTECHPYYTNALLKRVFDEALLPTERNIEKHWQNLVDKKRSDLLAETHALNLTQKKLLVAIAHGVTHALTSQAFLSRAKLSGASASRALQHLVSENFIEQDTQGHYSLIDPLLKDLIRQSTTL